MKLNVGSVNETKVNAVRQMIGDYPMFQDAEVVGIKVAVAEYGHPRSIQEVVDGAKDRARQAFQDGDYSFGIEGGLMEVPQTKTGYMEVTACAIYDGEDFHLGLSPAFEWPAAVIDGIINKGLDGSQALKAANVTDHEKVGTANGGVSILTNGRMDRTTYNKIAVQMALIHLEHPEFF